VNNLLHSIIHVGPNGPCGTRALIREHAVGRNIDIDLSGLLPVLLEELTIVLKRRVPIASLDKSIP
jgi:hypothetical protein